ncbi:MAG: hypothetical protein FD161_3499 [Limisphaerales bacterium]|nr:MAG: hypothetical protein FD161_3499 [Limisphaerales bacterium]KAG0507632.1 MAG: hypothetical protein E1N63_3165 [Limisphaerales bacterium]TXT51751.1 MAG: hypothetical protein FD140_1392 [Limisphaerales bacterium]
MNALRVSLLSLPLLLTALPSRADIEEVWRQRADGGGLAVADGTNAVFVAYTADFADGAQATTVTREFSGVTLTNNNGRRGFYLARYDGAGALQWLRQIGEAPRSPFGGEVFPYSSINRVRMDANTNLFICGKIAGGSPTTIGTNSFQSSNYYGACYIAKLDPQGTVLWARFVTGTDTADFNGLAVDASGNAFVCGQLYHRQDFGSIIVPNTGGFRPFVAKINGNGDWQWVNAESSGRFGGWAFAVATDASGNPYITGTMGGGQDSGNTFFGLPFPKVGESPFVAKFNGATGAATWVTNAPTQGFYALSNIGKEIAVLSDGSAYVGGHFYGRGVFGGTTLTPLQYAEGDVTMFLARISSAGQWLWATMGEATPRAISAVHGLALDALDNAWVQGYTSANFFYGAGTDGRVTLAGVGITNSAFIAQVNPSGTFLLARKTRSAGVVSPATDAAGYLYWTGDISPNNGLVKFGSALAPAITAQPAAMVVPLDAATNLTATATGAPVYFQWRKDGVPLDEQRESRSTNNTHSLTYSIPIFRTNDLGSYTLVVSNSAGVVTSAVAAVTAPAPTITGLFNTNNTAITNALAGSTLVIRGTNFNGATEIRLGVTRFALPFHTDTEIRVTLPVHHLEDSVTVTTPGGVATSPGTFIVPGAMLFTAFTNTVGNFQTFVLESSTNFAYQWFKDSVALTNDSRVRGADSGRLEIYSLVANDAGTYHVTATAGARTFQSTNLPLTVQPPPPNLSITGSSHTAGSTSGGIADFSVTATGDGPITYQWFKDGAALVDGGRVTGSTSNALRIVNLQTSDSGVYVVRLTVPSGSIAGPTMALLVTEPVFIASSPTNRVLTPGGTAAFYVVATGSPPLSYQWLKDGVPLTNDARISGATTPALNLANLVLGDTGAYACRVTNNASSTTSLAARLDPLAPPVFTLQPQSQTNRAATGASFFAIASGAPPITLQWRKDGSPLAGQTNNAINFSPVRLADAGSYTVVASNPGGSSTSAVATLTVTVRTNLPAAAEVVWVRHAGGPHHDRGSGVALDPTGNAFVTGTFGELFPAGPSAAAGTFGTNSLAANGRKQFFVAKLDAAGNYLWVRTASGTAEHEGFAVASDASGNAFVSGSFNGAATFGTNALVSAGSGDLFLTKLDGAGNFLWAAQAGRTNTGFWAALTVDAAGDAWWSGTFGGRLNLGTNSLASAGGNDLFLARLSGAGDVLWAGRYGGTNDDQVWSLALEPGGANLYLAGTFRTNTTFDATNLTGSGFSDGFVTKVSTNGAVQWALAAAGSGFDETLGVAADAGGVYFTGSSSGTNFTVGALAVTNLAGGGYGYLAKVNSNGVPVWLRRLNDSGGGHAVAVDPGGNPVVAGWLTLPAFDQEVFVARLDASGNPLGVAVAGGAGSDIAYGVAANADGVYLTGAFEAESLGGATFGANLLAGLGNSDIFIARLSGVPHRPLRIHQLDRPGGLPRVLFGHDDRTPLDFNRRTRLKVLASPDVNLPRASWQRLTNTVLTADGELQLDDAGGAGPTRRFYLIADEP